MIRTIRVTDSQLAHGRVIRRHLDGRLTVEDGTKRMTGYPLQAGFWDRCLSLPLRRVMSVALTVTALGLAGQSRPKACSTSATTRRASFTAR